MFTLFRKNVNNKKKKDIKYGIIRRDAGKCGLFSYFITMLGGINYCLQNNIEPIIDMQFYPNIYQLSQDDNAWEYFFEQPMKSSIPESFDESLIIDCDSIDKRPKLSMDFLTNENAVNYWRIICKKYIHVTENVHVLERKILDKYFTDCNLQEVVGVLARGTDYVELKPYGHPVQPTCDEIISKAIEVMERNHCKKILLISEDQNIAMKFENRLGTLVIVPEFQRYSDTGNRYLADIMLPTTENCQNAMNYLVSILMLSKCKCMVAGRTSGSVGAFILSNGFAETFFFNKGSYGIDDSDSYNLDKIL